MSWTHEHRTKLSAPPARVFAALTQPAELTRWFAEQVAVRLEPGGPFRFWGRHTLGTPTEREANQTITQVQPDRLLGFTWSLYRVGTEVTLALAEAEGVSTQVTLHHAVSKSLSVPREKELIDDHWRMAFGNLMCHLAGGDGILLPDYADTTPEIRISLVIEAPREAVFRALIEPESLNQWLASAAQVEPRVGGKYTLGWTYKVDGRDVSGGPTRILELVENKKLVVDWPDGRGDASVTGQTITFLLEPAGSGTRVTLVHAGFGRTSDLSDYPFGWGDFLKRLTALFPPAVGRK